MMQDRPFPINNKPPTIRQYVAMFNGKETVLLAGSLVDAKLKAINYFQPAKSKTHLVEVHLKEESNV